MILLFYAFAREIGPFKRRLKQRSPIVHEGLHGFSAELGGRQFTVVGHGIGHQRAGETARRAFAVIAKPTLVIATGVAGALSGGLKPGDLVLADRILRLDASGGVAEHVATAASGDLRELGRSLSVAGISYSTGAMLTATRVLMNGTEKRRAKEITGAIAVDMETAAIAAEAVARGIPFIAIRAVLDEVDDEVAGAEMADEHGRVNPLAASFYLVRNPGIVLKLPRMMRNLSRATNSIAGALEAIAYEGLVPGAKKKSSRNLTAN